ncbi:glycosyltransferase [Sulfurospirillum diekertiae]|uniref:D-inositol 3-phosphate glycosyltransferase n=1 Tax=Sulfurospirillum diekertiae TaxID=1854492 RepID=A0A1Y0HQR7_9BACT|nr:glycosyltransferase [Sulfurospirillum diekertiae]ARU49523.1 D-inositol 3-phosphate glycosyltransferase [Sulfurospirillum diekertiae]ASC94327.1 D-inositol 3-phosphate glycosyltransferase [Sulfurospirillum diekertiae]
MRIVIDLQGAQSIGSRNRGIGRYSLSLTKAIISNCANHEILVVLSGLFPDTIIPLRNELEGLLSQKNILVWDAPQNVSYIDKLNDVRRESAEYIRESFLATLNPDMVLVTSMFEGLVDDAVSSVGLIDRKIPTACILYDLIPLINSSTYLDNPDIKKWYEAKIAHLCKVDLLLSISESSRQEGIDYLGSTNEFTVNISTACEKHFRPLVINDEYELSLRARYSLKDTFIMYTGGIDHRKNIEGLIRAYSNLPQNIRDKHQLAIVCAIQENDRTRLGALAKNHGLDSHEIIFTGFVSEEDLVALYNLCRVFIFPSWHEGFGLPALEAMSCGKAVIGANTSSIPEVIGLEEALFDPKNDQAITDMLVKVLCDDDFRMMLASHGLVQAENFSWDKCAITAIKAIEHWHVQNITLEQSLFTEKGLKLAYISPLPPEKSGISDYSAELLPTLSKYYDIDVVVEQNYVSDQWIRQNCNIRSVEWFRENHSSFDRILYHFGNSFFHQHMFDLLMNIPGVVVLHDFYLSGILGNMEFNPTNNYIFSKALFKSHGYKAFKDKYGTKNIADTILQYPANLEVLQNSLGTIVHSENSKQLTKQWYGPSMSSNMTVIPLLRSSGIIIDRDLARQRLSIPKESFVICSFGFLGESKLNQRLLNAFICSKLSKEPDCYLIFVGENNNGQYGISLVEIIKKSGLKNRIKISGWVDKDTFRDYLASADIGVQLRTSSRGETSAAVLDCMNFNLPTIVNANGSMADLSRDTVWMLENEFTDRSLIEALETLWADEEKRKNLGDRGKDAIRTLHNPQECAFQYFKAIEQFYENPKSIIFNLIHQISNIKSIDEEILMLLVSNSLAKTFPAFPMQKQLFVDISEFIQQDIKSDLLHVVWNVLKELIENPPISYRIEPIYVMSNNFGFMYARQYTSNKILNIPNNFLLDQPIDFDKDDTLISFNTSLSDPYTSKHKYSIFEAKGVKISFALHDWLNMNNLATVSNVGNIAKESIDVKQLQNYIIEQLA